MSGVRQPHSGLERAGLAILAVALAVVFVGLGIAAWSGGEVFLAAMSGIGALMTLWAGGSTLRRRE